MTDVLISTISVFGHCFWRKLGAKYKRLFFPGSISKTLLPPMRRATYARDFTI